MLGQLRKEVVSASKPGYQNLGSQSHVVMQTDLVEEEEEDEEERPHGSRSAEPKSSESCAFKEPEVG